MQEDAARKRVSRAAEKLRTILASRGGKIGVPALTVGLAHLLAPDAPPALAARVTDAALAAAGTVAAEPANAQAESLDGPPAADAELIADGVLGHMTVLKAKVFLAYAAAFLLFCSLCGLVVHRLLNTTPATAEPARAVHETP
jgi:hypothetical protein